MKLKRTFLAAIVATCMVLCVQMAMAQAVDPLASWNEGKAKSAIVGFVKAVTDESSPHYMPARARVATFDNDGTLWAEKPLFFQLYFALDRVRALAPQHPEWTTREPFASVLKGDLAGALKGGEKALLDIFLATQTGMTTQEYRQEVERWIATARHPKTHLLFTDMVYQPMLELLAYLRANGFTTYIVSGGGTEFMRPWTEKVYGVEPERVVGSNFKTRYEMRAEGPVLELLPEVAFFTDKGGKPVAINGHIGRRPIAAFGNSDGDLQMLEWTSAGAGASLALLVHHTDAEREYAYDQGTEKALEEAAAKNWIVVDMKNDWKVVYPPRPNDKRTASGSL